MSNGTELKCPLCKNNITHHGYGGIAFHFRHEHKRTSDQVIGIIFGEINKLNEKINNLNELLEIKE